MELKLYRCAHCGNIVFKVVDKGVPLFCCGQKMEELTPNSAKITVKRSIMCQLLRDHGAGELAPIYFEESMKALCAAYNPDIQVEVSDLTLEGDCGYQLILKK